MLKKTIKYELTLTADDKKQILENSQELGRKFLQNTFYDTIDKIMQYLDDMGVVETLNALSFIPCIKEVKFAFDCNSIDYDDVDRYICEIVEWLENMPWKTREDNEFNLSFDYDEICKHFDGDQDKIRDFIVETDRYDEWLDFILSDARLEKYGTDLRNDFCKWLTSK